MHDCKTPSPASSYVGGLGASRNPPDEMVLWKREGIPAGVGGADDGRVFLKWVMCEEKKSNPGQSTPTPLISKNLNTNGEDDELSRYFQGIFKKENANLMADLVRLRSLMKEIGANDVEKVKIKLEEYKNKCRDAISEHQALEAKNPL